MSENSRGVQLGTGNQRVVEEIFTKLRTLRSVYSAASIEKNAGKLRAGEHCAESDSQVPTDQLNYYLLGAALIRPD